MKKVAVIVAGGAGVRMGGDLPKQFLLIGDKPVLYFTLKAFLEAFKDISIVLVLPSEHLKKGQEIASNYFSEHSINLVAGGETRFHSVKNGLAAIGQDPCVVFVHDGVRCLVSPELIQRCYNATLEFGMAIPAISSKDSIRLVDGNENKVLDRKNVMLIQTPQTFKSDLILSAFNTVYKDSFTDEATVVELAGAKIHLVEGEESNIKITQPVDLLIAKQYLGINA
jgi:2-C-methyl-D-erythritol 4-phosphate cytidylyltransferase